MSRPVTVVGHRQPDVDSICAAIAYARLLSATGTEAEPARAGEPNPETEFVLDYWDVNAPERIDAVDAGTPLALVDHNEYGQAIAGAPEADLVAVVDHHRIGDVTTDQPIRFRNEPVGSTATVLASMYDEADVRITGSTAGLLLAGLVSDTVLLRSPTTTEEDRALAERLADLAGVDLEEYGKAQLRRKGELGTKDPREVVLGDFKEFTFGATQVGIGQVETVDPAGVLDRRAAMLAAMDEVVAERDYDALLLLVTDLLEEDSTLLTAGPAAERAAAALDAELDDRTAFLPGVLSRKKQVVPPLGDAFE